MPAMNFEFFVISSDVTCQESRRSAGFGSIQGEAARDFRMFETNLPKREVLTSHTFTFEPDHASQLR